MAEECCIELAACDDDPSPPFAVPPGCHRRRSRSRRLLGSTGGGGRVGAGSTAYLGFGATPKKAPNGSERVLGTGGLGAAGLGSW